MSFYFSEKSLFCRIQYDAASAAFGVKCLSIYYTQNARKLWETKVYHQKFLQIVLGTPIILFWHSWQTNTARKPKIGPKTRKNFENQNFFSKKQNPQMVPLTRKIPFRHPCNNFVSIFASSLFLKPKLIEKLIIFWKIFFLKMNLHRLNRIINFREKVFARK